MSSSMIFTVTFLFVAVFSVAANPIQPRDFQIQNDDSGLLKALKDFGDSLTPEQKNQIKEITSNPISTKKQIADSIQNFFHSIGGEVETKYNALIEKLQIEGKKVENEIKANEGKMSEEEKKFVEKANEINANMDITNAENQKQIKDLIDSANPEMKAEIQGDIKKLIGALKNINITNL
uniref:Uncharacterized protein n=1 Tax=Panagrolaimus davidi TaxID=227884 RepID=A0A914PI65_9BILA